MWYEEDIYVLTIYLYILLLLKKDGIIPQYIPEFWWIWNCGSADDYDCLADQGNLTIQRNNLRYIKTTLNFWNELDGWKLISKTYIPPNAPTSKPYTFNPQLNSGFCKSSTCNHTDYFDKKYKFNTVFEIIYGGNGQSLVINEYFNDSKEISNNLRYCKNDPLYSDLHNCADVLPVCERQQ